MALSGVAAATRAFVTLLLFLANRYHLVLHISRDSSADELSKAFRKVMVKAHPDKGGSKEHAQKLGMRSSDLGFSPWGNDHEITLSRDERFFRNDRIRKSPQPSLHS